MSCHQNYSGAIKGFLIGSLLMFSLMFFGSDLLKNQSTKNAVPFDEAVTRLKSDNIDKVRIKGETAEFFKDEQMSYATGVTESQMNLLLEQIRDERLSVSFTPDAKDPLVYLIQILFWLFFISPPVIVVLLLIIIRKMDAKS